MPGPDRLPLLTVFEVRRMAQVARRTPQTAVSSYSEDEASWSGIFHMEDRRLGKRWLMTATLYAIGNDRRYTLDRHVEAHLTSFRAPNKAPVRIEYIVGESDKGVTYVVVRFSGQTQNREPNRRLTYGFLYKSGSGSHLDQSTTANHLIWKRTKENRLRLMANEDITGGLLKAAGVTNQTSI